MRRWYLDNTSPATLCIETRPGHIHGVLLDDLADEKHRRRWLRLVTSKTVGLTAKDLRDLEATVSTITL